MGYDNDDDNFYNKGKGIHSNKKYLIGFSKRNYKNSNESSHVPTIQLKVFLIFKIKSL